MINQEYCRLDKQLFTDSSLKTVYNFHDLKDKKIAKGIYFYGGDFPYVDKNNWRMASVFQDFYIPTASYEFTQEQGWAEIKRDLDPLDYEDFLFHEIKKNILEQYDKNKQVNLLLGGGIDSYLTASYVIAMGLENKTKFITMYDYNKKYKYTATNSVPLRNGLNLFFANFKNCQDWLEINSDYEKDLIDACNNKSIEEVRVCQTSSLFNRFQNEIFIGGHCANWPLLHLHFLVNDILINNPSVESDLERIFNLPNIYGVTFKELFVNDKLPLTERSFNRKRWDLLTGKNGNELNCVLGTEKIYNQTRRLNWNTITDPMEVCDALLVRRLIKKNVGDAFNSFICHETLCDLDGHSTQNLPFESLDSSIFDLPTNLNHNTQGVVWFAEEIKKAKNTGYISSNTVGSMLAIWEISKTINTVCANT